MSKILHPSSRKQQVRSSQLKLAREYRGTTQAELARMSNIAQSDISKYEKGYPVLSDEKLKRIMSVLGFPITFLDRDIKVFYDYNLKP